MPVELVDSAEGISLGVRVQPGARRRGVQGEREGALRIGVTEVAERGRANAAVVELLAELLDVPKSRIEVIKGLRSRDKRVLIRSATRSQLEKRLRSLVGGNAGT